MSSLSDLCLKEEISQLLKKDDAAIVRAIIVLNEKNAIKKCHSYMGKGCSDYYKKKGFLTRKQVDYWKQSDRWSPPEANETRISQYVGQLVKIAKEKANASS